MDSARLEAFVDDARSALEADPDMSTRTAELRITQPFLETLGWDVRGPEVEAGYRVGDEEIGFALGRTDDRAVLVETTDPSQPIDRDAARSFAGAMDTAGVTCGVLLNGWQYLLVVAGDGSLDHVEYPLDELPEHPDAISYYDRDAVMERVATEEAVRRRAAERLDDRRDDVTSDILDRLTAVTGEEVRPELSEVTRGFVDDLIVTLADLDDRTDVAGSTSGDAAEIDTAPSSESAPSADDDTDSFDGDSLRETGRDGDRPASERATDDREYVVRFFDGGTSVGAVGAQTPEGTLEQTLRYLEEGRNFLRRLSIPWSPEEDDERAVIADRPIHPDGSSMQAYRRVAGDYYLFTDMDESECRDVVEALAGSAGLRVMFQGAWDDE